MMVISDRDIRANQSKYVGFALSGEDVIVKARYGAWRVVPISYSDIVVNKRDLTEELRGALKEVKESVDGTHKLETLSILINELRDTYNLLF